MDSTMMSHRVFLPTAIAIVTLTAASSMPLKAQTPVLTRADRTALTTIDSQVKSDLATDIMPFWTRYTWDDQNGGFKTVVDRSGHPTAGDKYIIMQARMIWTLSAAHEFGLRDRGYLALAKKGVAFITDKMWDSTNGGFYMEVAADGTPKDTSKYLYAQEFVLYALSEYYRVSRDENARVWAERVFDLIQDKCADHQYGGYREDFDQKWNLLPSSLGIGGSPSCKTVNTHMHLMEAFTALVQADPKPRYEKALADVVKLMTAAITPQGYAIEPFTMDWKPWPAGGTGHDRSSVHYGHDVELAWLLMDAYRALGWPLTDLKKPALSLIDQALANGYDWQRGGIGDRGPRVGKLFDDPAYSADRKTKQWWQQAEALTAFIRAYRWTGNRRYLTAFEKQWSWVRTYQIDHKDGDWFDEVDWNIGAPTDPDNKGLGGWKVCYHDGRAEMNVAHELDGILSR
jgi:mannobiose 2-epimerase